MTVRASSRFQPQLSQPLVRQPAFRLYSTENQSKQGEQKEAEKDNGAASESETPDDPLRKELEEKKKEATDLKVYIHRLCSSHSLSFYFIDGQC